MVPPPKSHRYFTIAPSESRDADASNAIFSVQDGNRGYQVNAAMSAPLAGCVWAVSVGDYCAGRPWPLRLRRRGPDGEGDRRLRLFAGAMTGLAMLAGGGGYLGCTGQQAAERQAEVAEVQAQAATAARDDARAAKNEALRNQSLFLADLSHRQTISGNTMAGILLALEALPKDMDDPDRPYVAETETSLYRALFAHIEIAVLRGHRKRPRPKLGLRVERNMLHPGSPIWLSQSRQRRFA